MIFTHTDGSGVSIAIICDSVCDYFCLSVCPHDKTKTAETKITKSHMYGECGSASLYVGQGG